MLNTCNKYRVCGLCSQGIYWGGTGNNLVNKHIITNGEMQWTHQKHEMKLQDGEEGLRDDI